MSNRSIHTIMRRRARDGLMCTWAFLADTEQSTRIRHMNT